MKKGAQASASKTSQSGKPSSATIRIVFLGAPGSGKGTQSMLLSEKLHFKHISTGEMLRAEIANATEIGRKVQPLLDQGNLVPDEIIIDLLRKKLVELPEEQGFVLDGFPRTLKQAESLDRMLSTIGRPLTHILELVVDEKSILERIKLRGEAGSGRSDDNEEVAANRYRVFMEQTLPVIRFYESSGRLKKVDGLGSVDEVQEHILGALL